MAWLRLGVDTTRDAVDWVCCALAAHGCDGEVEITPADDASRWELTVRLYLPPSPKHTVEPPKLAEALEPLQRLGLASQLALETVPTGTRPTAPPTAPRRVGQRIVLLDHADEPAPAQDGHAPTGSGAGQVVVRIRPALAFGSGFHSSTLTCLALIERHVAPGMDALDLGCGAGILSLAMAGLGARVLALDNDPAAVATAREAVERNGLGALVEVATGSLGRGARLGHWLGWCDLAEVPSVDRPASFDLIATNILARVHAELADAYRRALRPAGLLITGGFTVDQEAEVDLALSRVGFEPLDRKRLGDYVALAHRAPTADPHEPTAARPTSAPGNPRVAPDHAKLTRWAAEVRAIAIRPPTP